MEARSRILISITGALIGAGLFLLIALLVGEYSITYAIPGFLGGLGLAICEIFSDVKHPPHPLVFVAFGLLSFILGLLLTYFLLPVQVPGHLYTTAPAAAFIGTLDYLAQKMSLAGLLALAVGILASWNLPNLFQIE